VQGSGFGLYTVSVEKMKSGGKTTSSDNSHQLPEDFRDNVAASLAQHILPEMGGVRITKLARFANRLEGIAERVAELKDRLDLEREVEPTARKLRILSGRVRAKIDHSLTVLRKADKDFAAMKDPRGKNVLRPGWLDFEPALKALERIEKRIGYLESNTAALIHPKLRTGDEENLAKQAPRKLTHLDVKPTPGSQKLMHRAVEVLDDEIRKFTDGKVPPGHVNDFIEDFLEYLQLGMKVDVANVKTIRARYHEHKLLNENADSSGTHR
jgi:hypothetical protein